MEKSIKTRAKKPHNYVTKSSINWWFYNIEEGMNRIMKEQLALILKATWKTILFIVSIFLLLIILSIAIVLIQTYVPTQILGFIMVALFIWGIWLFNYKDLKDEYKYAKHEHKNLCPDCGMKLDWTMTPNDDNDSRFGCQIFGEICSNCGYEHYDNQD